MAEKMGRLGFGGWGFVLGIAIVLIGGFWGLGWKTAGQVEEIVMERSIPAKGALCAQNFLNDENFEANLEALKAESSWSRDRFIRDKGKWSVMPEETSSDSQVATRCYRLLQKQLEIK